MEYRIIPMETYPRRAHFAYFSTMAQPYAGVTVSVEITHFLESVQEKGSPFFLSFLYCVSRAANQVPELRQRILCLHKGSTHRIWLTDNDFPGFF